MIETIVLKDFCEVFQKVSDKDFKAAFDRLDELTNPNGELYRQETIASSTISLTWLA